MIMQSESQATLLIPELPLASVRFKHFDSISEEELWYYDTDSLVSSGLTLYPNPADDICTAEVDASVEGERIIYLYDTYGHLVAVYPISEAETSTELEVEELTQGVYIVLLYVDGEFLESKLLVVNHP